MELNDAIEHTKNYKGMRVCVSGIMEKGQGRQYMRREMAKHFKQARDAWLTGDLNTVAEFFSIYTD